MGAGVELSEVGVEYAGVGYAVGAGVELSMQ